MKFSIIIPIYNCEKTLHVGVDSVLKQTYRDFELILINDGSKDNSLDLCRNYAEADERVRVIDQINAGAGPARNRGIAESKGDYLVFCDADDYYEPGSLAYFADAAQEEPDLIISSYREFRYGAEGNAVVCGERMMKAEQIRGQQAVRAAFLDLRKQAVVTAPWGKAYRRAVAAENNVLFPDLRRCQDVAFNLHFYDHVESITVIPQVTYNYQTPDDDSYLKKFPRNMFEIHKTVYELNQAFMLEWGVFDQGAKIFLDTGLRRDAVILLRLNYLNNWKFTKEEQKAFAVRILNDPVLSESLKTPVHGKLNQIIAAVLRSKSAAAVNLFSWATLIYQKRRIRK